jgi:tRNA(Ile)-lysidine synthase
MCIKTGAKWLLVAHTLDDAMETFLSRLARRSGVVGVAGMRPKMDLSDHVKLVRPLLSVQKVRRRGAALGVGLSHLCCACVRA